MGLNPIRLAFTAAVVVAVAMSVTLINSLPTFADVIVDASTAALCVVAGRKSRDWF